jgi:hypothetical protein
MIEETAAGALIGFHRLAIVDVDTLDAVVDACSKVGRKIWGAPEAGLFCGHKAMAGQINMRGLKVGRPNGIAANVVTTSYPRWPQPNTRDQKPPDVLPPC